MTNFIYLSSFSNGGYKKTYVIFALRGKKQKNYNKFNKKERKNKEIMINFLQVNSTTRFNPQQIKNNKNFNKN